MAKEFVGFVPGLLGIEEYVDYSRPSEKYTMLQKNWAEPVLMSYQTDKNRAPSYDDMCAMVATAIVKQQQATKTNGKIVASSVGAAVLRGALVMMAEQGHPMPDVTLIGPVWDIAATVNKLAGFSNVQALINGKIPALPMKVSGENAGNFPLTAEFFTQAARAADKPLPKLPSLTILTGANDQFCDADGAKAIIDSVPAKRNRVVLWKGGHNENNAERDHDILFALSNSLRRPNMFSRLRNAADRGLGGTIRHQRKRTQIKRLENKIYNMKKAEPGLELMRAQLNIMRRLRVSPGVR